MPSGHSPKSKIPNPIAPISEVYLKGETKPISPVLIATTLSKVATVTAAAAASRAGGLLVLAQPEVAHAEIVGERPVKPGREIVSGGAGGRALHPAREAPGQAVEDRASVALPDLVHQPPQHSPREVGRLVGGMLMAGGRAQRLLPVAAHLDLQDVERGAELRLEEVVDDLAAVRLVVAVE